MDPRDALDPSHHIAIVGMACDLPLADSPEAFWRVLAEGRCAVEDFDDAAMRSAGAREDELALPDYVRAGVRLAAHDQFDAAFFGLSPREAAVMDPQHRRFLQCAWAALEHAGHRPDSLGRQTGVFAGAGMGWYLIRNLIGQRELVEDMGEFLVRHLSNDKDFLSTRVSYQLDLRGPSLNVQTACSTSLVAVHLACQSLIAGECDMALAGGVTHELPQGQGYRYREEEVRSPDGRCRAFDANSGGTVFGSGAGIVVLRRLGDALRDGDTVHAVIRGTAINNDGAGKVGYLAPSVDGQAEAAAQALAVAGVNAGTIGYVEAHGTGTRLGDPIEIAALSQAFDGAAAQGCAIGSVKTNIGHLDTAAGVAGLIKTALALQNGEVPASLFFESANPEIDFAHSPFAVAARRSPWPKPGPRRAAVNSLGVGGTNAFAVLEQAPREGEVPVDAADVPQATPIVLALSAKTPEALRARADDLAVLLETTTLPLADVAWTLREGRVSMPLRASVAARTRAEAARALRALSSAPEVGSASAPVSSPSLVFAFPGQGAQAVGMARDIARDDPAVRAALDECVRELRVLDANEVVELLLEAEPTPANHTRLRRTEVAQPALFAVEYALAKGLLARGMQPAAMLGHSLGEYVAATLAGVFTLPAALRLMQVRGALCARAEKGAMLAVQADAEALRARLPPALDLAAMNTPEQTVVAGPEADIAAFEAALAEAGIGARRLTTSAAFHSRLLDPVLDDFRSAVEAAAPRRVDDLRVVSTCTGTWLAPEQAASADYWVRHLRQPVRFVDALATLDALKSLLVEVGPGRTLAKFASARRANALVLPVMPDVADGASQWANLPGLLWASGMSVDWSRWQQPMHGRRVPLPGYRFAPTRHWIDAPAASGARIDTVDRSHAPLPPEDWLQTPVWQPAPLAVPSDASAPASALVLCDGFGIGDALADRLQAAGTAVRRVRRADEFAQDGEAITLDPSRLEHWQALAATPAPAMLIDLWAMDAPSDDLAAEQRIVFDDALRMAQGLSPWADAGLAWLSVSVHAQAVGDAAALRPGQALRAGPVRTWPQEATALRACWFDLDAAALAAPARAADALFADVLAGVAEETVALRGRHRWVPHWRSLGVAPSFDESPASAALPPIPSRLLRGVVLLTGGFGGAGRAIAESLATAGGIETLWLLARAPLAAGSPRAAWVEALRVLGLDARVLVADLTAPGALAEAVAASGIIRLDVVLHAAGVLDDALIAMKSLDAAHAVLAPKLQGAVEVARVAESCGAAQVLYFSSISAQMGASGQVDYTAANAFLDAFAARADAQSTHTRHIALAFSIWREAGMAARLAAERGLAPPPFEDGLPQAHPLLRHRREENGAVVFGGVVGAASDWVLDGHRLANGVALLPGTGLLDLLAWGLHALRGRFTPFACEGLTIAAPLVFAAGESRQIALRFAPASASAYDVSLRSRGAGDEDTIEHAALRVDCLDVTADARTTAPLVLGAARTPREPRYAHPSLRFGPEWDCLRGFTAGDGEAELQLEATRGFDGSHPLHPALLDMALGAAQGALAPAGVDAARLLPFRYGRIEVLAPLPARVTSRQRGRGVDDGLSLDVDVLDADGATCVRVRDFLLKPARRLAALPRAARRATPGSALLEVGFRDGFDSAEALAAIRAALAHGLPANVALARRPVDALVADTRRAANAGDAVEATSAGSATPVPRRAGGTAFVAPATPLQSRIIALWERLLDLSGIGIEDDFFALGGHSLLLTRALSRLKREDGVALPIDAAFDAPRIRDWSALAEQAAPDRDIGSLPPLVPAPRVADADGRFRFTTTHSQRQLFYVQATAPDTTAYNIPFAFTLRGALDADALSGAIADVVAMHEALRTHFELVDGEVRQVVDPHATAMHEQVDLSALPEAERRAALAEVRELVARHVFDLTAGPPCLFLTVKLAADQHVLLFCLHHVLVDHLAVLHIGRALESRYALRRRTGSAARVTPAEGPALQLPDFAVWQASALDAAAIAHRLPHWMETLAACPPALALPTDRPRPPRQDFGGAEYRLAFSVATSARLRAFAQATQQTSFTVVLAALARMLAELTGEERLVIGCPFANRSAEELEPVVGLFMNLLPIGLHLPADQSVDALMAQVRRQITRTQAVQDTPFPEILKALGVPRDPSRNPLVQVWYTFQEAPMALRFEGLEVGSEALPNGGSKLDLSFWFWDDGERVRGLVEYATALFDESTVAGFAARLETVVDGFASDVGVAPVSVDDATSTPTSLDSRPIEA